MLITLNEYEIHKKNSFHFDTLCNIIKKYSDTPEIDLCNAKSLFEGEIDLFYFEYVKDNKRFFCILLLNSLSRSNQNSIYSINVECSDELHDKKDYLNKFNIDDNSNFYILDTTNPKSSFYANDNISFLKGLSKNDEKIYSLDEWYESLEKSNSLECKNKVIQEYSKLLSGTSNIFCMKYFNSLGEQILEFACSTLTNDGSIIVKGICFDIKKLSETENTSPYIEVHNTYSNLDFSIWNYNCKTNKVEFSVIDEKFKKYLVNRDIELFNYRLYDLIQHVSQKYADELQDSFNDLINGNKEKFSINYYYELDSEIYWVNTKCVVTKRSNNGEPLIISGVSIDITDKVKKESEVVSALEQLNLASKAAKFFTWNVDVKNEIIQFQEGSHKLGYYPEDVNEVTYNQVLERLSEVTDNKNIEKVLKAYRCLSSGKEETINEEFKVTLNNKESWHFYSGAVTKYDEYRNPIAITGVIIDNTEQKAKDGYINLAAQSANINIWTIRLVDNKAFFKVQVENMGISDVDDSEVDLISEWSKYSDINHKSDFERYINQIKKIMNGQSDKIIHEFSIVDNGNIRYFMMSGAVSKYDESNKPLEIYGITQEITEEKIREKRLRDISAQYQLAAKSSKINIWTIEFEGDKAYFEVHIDNIGRNDFLNKRIELYSQWQQVKDNEHRTNQEEYYNQLENIKNKRSEKFELEFYIGEDTETKYFRMIGSVSKYDKDSNPIQIYGITQEITEEKLKEKRISEISNDFLLAANAAKFSTWTIRKKNNEYFISLFNEIIYTNEKNSLITVSLDKYLEFYSSSLNNNSGSKLKEKIYYALENKLNSFDFEFSINKDNKKRHFRITGAVSERDDNGNVIVVPGITIDQTEQIENRLRIENLINYDELTGMLSRNSLYKLIGNINGSVIHVDMDNTKLLNDGYGQKITDEIIKIVAKRISVLSRGYNCYRTNDEFIIYLENNFNEDEVLALSNDILLAIRRPIYFYESEIFVTASIGVVVQTEEDDYDSIFKKMDYASSLAKKRGRNQIVLCDDKMNKLLERQTKIELSIKRAIEDEQFYPYFQSKFDLESGKIIGVEALVRWDTEELGMIYPDEFIPILERRKLISKVDKIVAEKSIIVLNDWLMRGIIDPTEFILSFNFSIDTVLSKDIIEFFKEMKLRYCVPYSNIEIEITESIAAKNFEELRKRMKKFYDLGIHTSLDDFSAGNSTMVMLSSCEFSTLKIDKGMILNTNFDESAQLLYKFMVKFCDKFNFNLVAEGVETEEHVNILLDLGVKTGQGYYKNKPLPREKFENLLISN